MKHFEKSPIKNYFTVKNLYRTLHFWCFVRLNKKLPNGQEFAGIRKNFNEIYCSKNKINMVNIIAVLECLNVKRRFVREI